MLLPKPLPFCLAALLALVPLSIASAQEWELHMKPKPQTTRPAPAQRPVQTPTPPSPPSSSSPAQTQSGWDLHVKPRSAAPSAELRPNANSPRALAAFLENSSWDGALFLRNRKPMRATVRFLPRGSTVGSLLSVQMAVDAFGWSNVGPYHAFTLNRDGDLRIGRVADAGDSTPRWFATIWRETLIDPFDRTVLRIGMSGGVIFLTRRAQGDDPGQRCSASSGGHEAWLLQRLTAWTLARDLKIEFDAGLAKLDEARASLAEVFADETVKARLGGANLATIDEAGFRRAMLDLYDCLLTREEIPRRELLTGLVDADLLTRHRAAYFADRDARLPLPPQPLATLAQAREIAEATRRAEQELPMLLAKAGSMAALAPLAERLSQVRPAVLKAALAQLKTQAATQSREEAEKRAAERERRAAERMRGVRFPDSAISAARTPMMRQLVAGKLTRLHGEELSYVGGFADWSVNECGLPTAVGDRIMLLALIDPARQRVKAGADYANPNLGQSLGSAAANQAAYIEGATSAKAIGCRQPFLSAALASMVELAAAVKQEADGSASLFERSCRLDRAASDCACILQVGQASMPDIADQRYSRNLVGSLIQRNPLTGFKLAACGVTTY